MALLLLKALVRLKSVGDLRLNIKVSSGLHKKWLLAAEGLAASKEGASCPNGALQAQCQSVRRIAEATGCPLVARRKESKGVDTSYLRVIEKFDIYTEQNT